MNARVAKKQRKLMKQVQKNLVPKVTETLFKSINKMSVVDRVKIIYRILIGRL